MEHLTTLEEAQLVQMGRTSGEAWEDMAKCSFVACPAGVGVDTHRLWETLIIGRIPIIERLPPGMQPLVEGLPVVQVDSWHEVTSAALRKWKATLRPAALPALHQPEFVG